MPCVCVNTYIRIINIYIIYIHMYAHIHVYMCTHTHATHTHIHTRVDIHYILYYNYIDMLIYNFNHPRVCLYRFYYNRRRPPLPLIKFVQKCVYACVSRMRRHVFVLAPASPASFFFSFWHLQLNC